MILERPNPELVRQYLGHFEADVKYRVADEGLTKLFTCYPRNNNLDEVYLKAAALNTMYSTSIFDVFGITKHIVALRIDDALQSHSLDLVQQIADVNLGGKPRRCYSFATKYCSWHQPGGYPIYDSFVEDLLWLYEKNDAFASFQRNELSKYPRFHAIVTKFRAYYEIEQFSFKELDKFLWYYGKEVSKNKKRS